MRKFNYIFMSVMALLLLACGGENVSDPAFDSDEMPYIYMEWAGTLTYHEGDTIRMNAEVSPLSDTDCRWMADGNVISTADTLCYVVGNKDFTLRFEAERNGKTNFRTALVTVIKDFKAKEYKHIVTGVITGGITADQIQWDCITHLQYSQLTVDKTTGELTLPDAKELNALKTIVTLAHNNGVYVFIDVAGPTAYPNGAGTYNESSFNTVATDPALRAILIKNLKEFVEKYQLDGVNITMNNLNNDAGALADHDGLTAFFNDLADAFPAERVAPFNHFFLTASVPMAWNDYEFYFLGNAKRLDWVNFNLYGATDLSPVPSAPDWQIADHVTRFSTAAGIPSSKMVVGIAAYGVKYDIPAGVSPTWGTLDGMLSYPTWSEILAMDSGAGAKSMLNVNSGLFYTGLTGADNSVAGKAALVRQNAVAGMFLWTINYDTSNAATSLLRAIHHEMNE